MQRRLFLHQTLRLTALGTAATIGAIGIGRPRPSQAQTSQAQTTGNTTPAVNNRLAVTYLGHTCFQFQGGGLTVMANPFRPGGCTAGYAAPDASRADVTVISSLMLDEGETGTVDPDRLLFESGIYQMSGVKFEGIPIAHDLYNGRRFGQNIIWTWTQAGVKVVHLGGGKAPLRLEDRILIGRPDVLLLPIGGGDKAYSPTEAFNVMRSLNPKVVIPTHYRTAAADEETCTIEPLDSFLNLDEIEALTVYRPTGVVTFEAERLPSTTAIYVLSPPRPVS